MKTKIRVVMILLSVILLGVLVLGIQGVIQMETVVNVVVIDIFIGGLLVLLYFGQIEMVKKILLS